MFIIIYDAICDTNSNNQLNVQLQTFFSNLVFLL